MDMYGIIQKKRDGGRLTKEEIEYFIQGVTERTIPDYQTSALLMAIYLQKMNKEETYYLTDAMRRSGETADLSAIRGCKVDKHSTGGVGDKTTMIVAPLVAACGVPVAKMSGRGLGFTGGTIDKLESIPGFQTDIDRDHFIQLVNQNGLAVIGQTEGIACADKQLYAFRDVTATVDNISLICSSIMSKKLASGSDAIVLDIKCGSGALIQDRHRARQLGQLMVEMGKKAGKRILAALTNMDQPLGREIGNAREVNEAIAVLQGKGPEDITVLSVFLAGMMLYAGGAVSGIEEGRKKAKAALDRGAGLEKMEALIAGQGGDARILTHPDLLPQAAYHREVRAAESGYLVRLQSDRIGFASQHTGAGRETKMDQPDLSAGISMEKKRGDHVNRGEVMAILHGNDPKRLERAAIEYETACRIGDVPPLPQELILELLT